VSLQCLAGHVFAELSRHCAVRLSHVVPLVSHPANCQPYPRASFCDSRSPLGCLAGGKPNATAEQRELTDLRPCSSNRTQKQTPVRARLLQGERIKNGRALSVPEQEGEATLASGGERGWAAFTPTVGLGQSCGVALRVGCGPSAMHGQAPGQQATVPGQLSCPVFVRVLNVSLSKKYELVCYVHSFPQQSGLVTM